MNANPLTEALNRAFDALAGQVAQYSRVKPAAGQKSLSDHWVTIGGHPDSKGHKHAGGTPVKVDKDGQIVAGPKPLEHRQVSDLKGAGEKPETAPRSPVNMATDDQLHALESAKDAVRDKQGVIGTKPKLETVPAADLIATQKRAHPPVIDEYRGKEHPPLEGTRLDGKVFVEDGHHRLAAGLEDGKKEFQVHVLDLDAAGKGGDEKQEPDHDPIAAAEAEYREHGTRAKAFKAWFGEWEHDPANASKVVNEKGEPQEQAGISGEGSQVMKDGKPVTVYHGTQADFNEFDPSKDSGQNLYGPGFYFTEAKVVAAGEFEEDSDWREFPSQEEAKAAAMKAPGMLRYHEPYQDHATGKWMAPVGYRPKVKAAGYAQKGIKVTPQQRGQIGRAIEAHVDGTKGYWSTFERERIKKELKSFKTGATPMGEEYTIDRLRDLIGGQPYNVDVFKFAHQSGVNLKGNVHEVYLNIRKPLHIDRLMDHKTAYALADAVSKLWGAHSAAKKLRSLGDSAKNVENDKTGRVQWASHPSVESALADVSNDVIVSTRSEKDASGKEHILQTPWSKKQLKELAQEAGFDGLTHTGGLRVGGHGEHRVWIAFGGNQIKAVQNRGTFDPNENRIDYGLVREMNSMIAKYAAVDAPLRRAIASAAAETDTEPTFAEKDAGNFRKGRFPWNGMQVVIENPAGSIRRGVNKDGTAWESPRLPSHYGYLSAWQRHGVQVSEADGSQIDVHVGPDPESELVFVIDQCKADGAFQDHKCMIGFHNDTEAREAYLGAYQPGWKGLQAITAMTLPEFRDWLENGDTRRPVAKYALSEMFDQAIAKYAEDEKKEPDAGPIEHGEIPKEAVLYIFRPEVNITCQKCVFLRGERCAVLGPDETVSPEHGSCGFYIHGDLGEAKEIPWIGFITKDEAGYAENKQGFQCKRCEYFNVADNSCRKVDKDSDGDTPGMIHPNGCCNHWEADDTRAKLGPDALAKLLASHSKA